MSLSTEEKYLLFVKFSQNNKAFCVPRDGLISHIISNIKALIPTFDINCPSDIRYASDPYEKFTIKNQEYCYKTGSKNLINNVINDINLHLLKINLTLITWSPQDNYLSYILINLSDLPKYEAMGFFSAGKKRIDTIEAPWNIFEKALKKKQAFSVDWKFSVEDVAFNIKKTIPDLDIKYFPTTQINGEFMGKIIIEDKEYLFNDESETRIDDVVHTVNQHLIKRKQIFVSWSPQDDNISFILVKLDKLPEYEEMGFYRI